MTVGRAFAVLVLLMGLCGCAGVEVQSDFNRRCDFGKYRTFAWFEEPQTTGWDLLPRTAPLHDQVRAAVQRELSAKGIRLQTREAADFFIAPHLVAAAPVDDAAWGYGLGSWGHGAASGG